MIIALDKSQLKKLAQNYLVLWAIISLFLKSPMFFMEVIYDYYRLIKFLCMGIISSEYYSYGVRVLGRYLFSELIYISLFCGIVFVWPLTQWLMMRIEARRIKENEEPTTLPIDNPISMDEFTEDRPPIQIQQVEDIAEESPVTEIPAISESLPGTLGAVRKSF